MIRVRNLGRNCKNAPENAWLLPPTHRKCDTRADRRASDIPPKTKNSHLNVKFINFPKLYSRCTGGCTPRERGTPRGAYAAPRGGSPDPDSASDTTSGPYTDGSERAPASAGVIRGPSVRWSQNQRTPRGPELASANVKTSSAADIEGGGPSQLG